VAALRPIPIFNTVNYYEFGVNSIYNAGQITLRKRGRGGLFYRLNYAYSKSIDEASQITGTSDGGFAGAEDPRNLKLERGRSDWDRGHVVTANFSWTAPFGRGQRFLGSAHGLVQGALGGWNLSGTASFATGSPITILTNGSNQNIGEFPRPNRIAKGIPADQPGKRGVDYPWFDVNAFQPVPACVSVTVGCPADAYGFLPFQDANSGRNILDGPGYQYINMAVMKNFPVRERKIIQFRLESFNIFNHANLMLPDNNFNTTTAGLINKAVETGRGGPRVFQASLKFMF
jgi:hypothetical protein